MFKEKTKPNYVHGQYFKEYQKNLSYRMPQSELHGKVKTIIGTNTNDSYSVKQICSIIFNEPKAPNAMELTIIGHKNKQVKRVLGTLIDQGYCKIVKEPMMCGGVVLGHSICYGYNG